MPASPYEIYSAEYEEIIGHVPHWIVRWGISLLCFLLVLVLLVSLIIRYPDTLPADAYVLANEQPFKLSWYRTEPETNYHLLITERQAVRAGQLVLEEENIVTHQKHPFVTPIAGRAYLMSGRNPKVSMLMVVPAMTGYEIQLKLPVFGAGRVRRGQSVLIRLDNYPAREYGTLNGRITAMVPVPVDSTYSLTVRLATAGLVTSVGKAIPLESYLSGKAEIMLDERSLFDRLFLTY